MNTTNIYTPKTDRKLSLAVFLSGSGTNFEALINKQLVLENDKNCPAEIGVVFSNVPDCQGIKKANSLGVKTVTFSSKKFFESIGKPLDDEPSRELYDQEVINLLEREIKPDIIVLAGYRRKLSGIFHRKYRNKIINMYPGDVSRNYLVEDLPASVQAIRNNDIDIKCTVYIDREGQRFGPAIAQSKPVLLEKYNEENITELDREIREKAEWVTLPFVIFDIISHGRLSIDESDNIYLDGIKLPSTGYQL